MDLQKMLDDAVAARSIVAQLPDGLRQHAEQFEDIIRSDLAAQTAPVPQTSIWDMINPLAVQVARNFLLPRATDWLKGKLKHPVTLSTAATIVINAIIKILEVMNK